MSKFTVTVTNDETGEQFAHKVDGYYLGFYTTDEEGEEFDDTFDGLDREDIDYIIDCAIDTMLEEFPSEEEEDFLN